MISEGANMLRWQYVSFFTRCSAATKWPKTSMQPYKASFSFFQLRVLFSQLAKSTVTKLQTKLAASIAVCLAAKEFQTEFTGTTSQKIHPPLERQHCAHFIYSFKVVQIQQINIFVIELDEITKT